MKDDFILTSTQYAKDNQGNTHKAHRKMNTSIEYFCMGCGDRLIPAPGKINAPHFRHKNKDSKGCTNPESYIHWVTKELFAEHYNSVSSFFVYIDITQKCKNKEADNLCQREKTISIDLKKIFPYVEVEKYSNGLYLDCLLYNEKDEKLFFEVCYTSPVSENKIKTKIPIIEIKVNTPKDIDKIISKNYISKHIINFKSYNISEIIKEDCLFSCTECIVFRPPPAEEYKKHKQVMSQTDKLIGDILMKKSNNAYRDWQNRMRNKYKG